ncbi:MAG TPA: CHAT domain-containing tetratricopeptide repeat protein [Vicinamibacterales bacterium]|nr:CHAT domain-containing tetratricopeptide repeat protein [Vicinamibacterales bacterium]
MVPSSRMPFQLWLLLLVPLASVHGQERSIEPPAPEASPAVRRLLDEAARSSQSGAATKAFDLNERALALAQETADHPGEAQAQSARATVLTKSTRTREALAAWRDAESAWMRIGDGPGQVEAVVWQAILEIPDQPQDAEGLLRSGLDIAARETRRPRTMSSILSDLASELVDRSRIDAASQTYELAASLAQKVAPGSLEHAASVNGLGRVAFSRGDFPTADDYFRRALTIREGLNPESLESAGSLNNLSNLERARGNLDAARDFGLRALAIAEKVAPGSLMVASCLNNLGLAAFFQGDLTTARDFHQRALAIRESAEPDSLLVARSLGNLSNVANEQGELTLARAYGERAVAITAKIAPDSAIYASQLGDLGSVAGYQGDHAVSRAYRERALAIFEKLSPDSLDVAVDFNNLGMELRMMGDLAGARDYHQRALEIRQRRAPNSLFVASSLKNLAGVAADEGNLTAAGEYAAQSLAIREKLAPNSLLLAEVLETLGEIAQAQGDLRAARDHQENALAIEQRIAPNSIYVFSSLTALGALAYEEGDRGRAREYHDRALALGQKLAPNSIDIAENLTDLGSLAFDDGDVAAAAQYAGRAWDIVRTQGATVVGDEAQQAFQSRYRAIGGQLVRFQVASGKSEEGFVTLEEGRAQALSQLLAERSTARHLAPADVWEKYEHAQAEDNQAGKILERAGTAEANAKLALDAEVAQQSSGDVITEKQRILSDRAQATEQARQAATRTRMEAERRWVDVRHTIQSAIPTLTPTAEGRRLLPPDAVLISFAVGDRDTTLFAVPREGPVRAFTLALPAKELAARVDFVRRTVSREAGARGAILVASEDVRIRAARDLYQKLFPADAREIVAGAKRVVLSPDGALWDLPFAALVINNEGDPHYLGLEKPLVYTQSLTTLVQTIQRAASRRPAEKPNVLIVGNPLFDNSLRNRLTQGRNATSAASSGTAGRRRGGELALLSRDGEIPEPLPYAEREAKEVAALYGARASVGNEPTESWFRQRAATADIIHLATHGYFNPLRAMSSGLRLAAPEQEPSATDTSNDGALQAWEVFTQLQLRAELVVLSACQTGVGARVPGEGLVGLTRAFQVAGAASVVATQWRVSDVSTATGMVAFHQQLRRGTAKDRALQQAMLKVAANPATSHPYYWAPFILVGDFQALPQFVK